MTDPVVIGLARQLVAARQGKDRAALRRLRREGQVARQRAWGAQQAALAAEHDARFDAAQRHELVVKAASLTILVAALDLADNPELMAGVPA